MERGGETTGEKWPEKRNEDEEKESIDACKEWPEKRDHGGGGEI